MLAGLMEDTLEVYDLGVELLSYKAKAGLPMEETLGYAAFTKFYGAAKKLANTSLAQLKEEGLETSFNEGDSTSSLPNPTNYTELEGSTVSLELHFIAAVQLLFGGGGDIDLFTLIVA